MEETSYLVISPDGLVENIIIWNGVAEFAVADGYSIELPPSSGFYNIGMYKQPDGNFYYKWADGTFNLEPETV